MIDLMRRASRIVGIHIRRESSTNWLWEIGGDKPWRVRLEREWSEMVALRVLLSPSARIMKRKGERGSPCLMPLVSEKGLEGTPLIRMENRAEEVRLTIQETQVGSKPKARRVDLKQSQLILSKAFERSSFRSIPGVFVEWSKCITS
jgi:hypothetical protein